MTEPIRFEDGAGYERYMGAWSRLVGDAFLTWLAPDPGGRWLDVGCGNGAFTELIVTRAAPLSVDGIDPSDAQLIFARSRPALHAVSFRQGTATALPYPAGAFDAAVMPLVLFFVPDPQKGVTEMARVVRSGGVVAAYNWDMEGGGFPYALLQASLRELGASVPSPPHPEVSNVEVMRALWSDAGLTGVTMFARTVERTFADFEDYWSTVQLGPSVSATLAALSAEDTATLRMRLQSLLPTDSAGRIAYSARAFGVQGRVG
jgi:SAM-dependent methyltransferase